MLHEFQSKWQEQYEEYISCTTQLERLIKQLAQNGGGDDDSKWNAAQNLVRDAGKAISSLQQLTIQSHGISDTERGKYRSQLGIYRTQLEGLKKDLRSVQFTGTLGNDRTGGSNGSGGGGSGGLDHHNERQQLLHGQQILDSTDRALLRGKQILSETEDIAVDTSTQVHEQGQQLEGVLDDLHHTNDIQDRARRVMLGMARRMMTDRIIQTFIILIELGIIGLLVWYRFFKK